MNTNDTTYCLRHQCERSLPIDWAASGAAADNPFGYDEDDPTLSFTLKRRAK